jgi:hypothetical protein
MGRMHGAMLWDSGPLVGFRYGCVKVGKQRHSSPQQIFGEEMAKLSDPLRVMLDYLHTQQFDNPNSIVG